MIVLVSGLFVGCAQRREPFVYQSNSFIGGAWGVPRVVVTYVNDTSDDITISHNGNILMVLKPGSQGPLNLVNISTYGQGSSFALIIQGKNGATIDHHHASAGQADSRARIIRQSTGGGRGYRLTYGGY